MNGIQFGSVTEQHDSIIIVASGSSLIGFDFRKLENCGHIICVNNSYKGLEKFDSWFTLDPWGLSGEQPPKNFKGTLYAAVPQDFGTNHARVVAHKNKMPTNIIYLHRLISHNKPGVSSETAYRLGLSEDNGCINTGNSGFGAINLAYHMRPKKILLLGLDATVGYYYSKTEKNRPLDFLPMLVSSAKDQLENTNTVVINGSKDSKIDCFSRYEPNMALEIFKNV